jgi:hypothetical protein
MAVLATSLLAPAQAAKFLAPYGLLDEGRISFYYKKLIGCGVPRRML